MIENRTVSEDSHIPDCFSKAMALSRVKTVDNKSSNETQTEFKGNDLCFLRFNDVLVGGNIAIDKTIRSIVHKAS